MFFAVCHVERYLFVAKVAENCLYNIDNVDIAKIKTNVGIYVQWLDGKKQFTDFLIKLKSISILFILFILSIFIQDSFISLK